MGNLKKDTIFKRLEEIKKTGCITGIVLCPDKEDIGMWHNRIKRTFNLYTDGIEIITEEKPTDDSPSTFIGKLYLPQQDCQIEYIL